MLTSRLDVSDILWEAKVLSVPLGLSGAISRAKAGGILLPGGGRRRRDDDDDDKYEDDDGRPLLLPALLLLLPPPTPIDERGTLGGCRA